MNLDFILIVMNLGIINNVLYVNNLLIIYILLYMNKKKIWWSDWIIEKNMFDNFKSIVIFFKIFLKMN